MKKIIYLAFMLLIIGCSNPNQEYLNSIEEYLTDSAMGLELNYKSIEFEIVETITFQDRIDSLHQSFEQLFNQLTELEFYVRDDIGEGKIFSLDFLTKDRLTKIRNWEKNWRGVPFRGAGGTMYSDYYEFAKENPQLSDWIVDLNNHIDRIDSILENYDDLNQINLNIIETVYWFYLRIENYYTSRNPGEVWVLIGEQINNLNVIETEINTLKENQPDEIYHIKAVNKYTVDNPMFGGTKQTSMEDFYFDKDLKVIRRVTQ